MELHIHETTQICSSYYVVGPSKTSSFNTRSSSNKPCLPQSAALSTLRAWTAFDNLPLTDAFYSRDRDSFVNNYQLNSTCHKDV